MSLLPADWAYHRVRKLGVPMVLDIHSSQVKPLSDAAYELLPYATGEEDGDLRERVVTRYGPHAVEAALKELGALATSGFITRPDLKLGRRIAAAPTPLKVMFLHVAHDCNLACRYCFAGQGSYRARVEYMTPGVAQAAVDLLMRESDEEGALIRFFGGEPLLNFDLMRTVVAYAKERARALGKKLNFSIFTNATVITDEIARFLAENNFEILISLDGPPRTNDRMRVQRNGEPSYHLVIEGVKTLRRYIAGRHIGCRVVLTPQDLDLVEIVGHILGLGIWKVMFGKVWETGSEPYAFKPVDVERLKAGFTEIAATYTDSVLRGKFHWLGINPLGGFIFRQLEGGNKDVYHCLAGRKSAAVTPSGDIWPCFHFVGRERFHLGHVTTGINESVRQRFVQNYSENRKSCRSCWARYLCGGGCPANHLARYGDITKANPVQCDIDRHVLELSMYAYARVVREAPHLLERLKVIGHIKEGYYSDKGFVEHLETAFRLPEEAEQ
ncbi:MAG: SPASM domain-containing protein [Acetobacteraceae bacterium]|nr:SPASM domain-containing protein [Acetobacteraceae bacterium]